MTTRDITALKGLKRRFGNRTLVLVEHQKGPHVPPVASSPVSRFLKRGQRLFQRNVEAKAIPSYVTLDADKTLEEKVKHLGILADDAESRASHAEASARHKDRIEAATAAAKCREGTGFMRHTKWMMKSTFFLCLEGASIVATS